MIQDVVTIGPHQLDGELVVPDRARGLILFAHGSGSNRFSPRNRFVSESLNGLRLGTLLFDLLSEDEATNRANVFDIGLLSSRLGQAIQWCRAREDLLALRIGLFGASTGAAAALVAAAAHPRDIDAVVSRGGRPDLASTVLAQVRAATLLIVGADDAEVLALNRSAWRQLACEKRLEVVPRATHLFMEAGALESVARIAGEWFVTHLSPPQD